MQIKKAVLILVVLLLAITIGSCKKNTEVEQPQPFDPEIDGIAVVAMPEMDIQQAEKIVRSKTYSPIADATQEAEIAPPAPPAPAPTAAPAAPAPATASAGPAAPAGAPGTFDPNAF